MMTTTTTRLARADLASLALRGALAELQNMERTLALYHKRWPQLFVGRERPQLLAPDVKDTPPTNGAAHHWPDVVRSTTPTKPAAAPEKPRRRRVVWTPAMRARAAERMRKMHHSGAIARGMAKARKARRQQLKAIAQQ